MKDNKSHQNFTQKMKESELEVQKLVIVVHS
jgi:hypothetical protein